MGALRGRPSSRAKYLWCFASAMMMGCNLRMLDLDHALISRTGSETRLIVDSPVVEQLLDRNDPIAGQPWPGHSDRERIDRYRDESEHPENYRSGTQALLDSLAKQAAIAVQGRQYFRRLRESLASCEPTGLPSSDKFIFVSVSTGSSKGAKGWVCTKDVGATGEGVF